MNELKQKVQKYKLFLFGKDVLSIIDKYDPEGFDIWSQLILNVNKEYHSLFKERNGELTHKIFHFVIANYRSFLRRNANRWDVRRIFIFNLYKLTDHLHISKYELSPNY